ncbi:ultraviolet-B receptor UVR8 [Trichoplusia ni]|uniref:Ultraviolet-B receptor UVR8 n=1 Tax=Trichoplusia ni TaxID=7111 RepID=A0A7E5VF14_TRINI|nr:ultraviolet-B receptor UVR8 [Trichoplusia ni]
MTLWCWGANSHGQLGLGTVSEQVEKPAKVELHLYDNKVQQIACGGGHTLLIDDAGKLYSSGWNNKLQTLNDTEEYVFQRTWKLSGITFTNIACGWDFSCGVTDDQYLFVWGSNAYGQLGLPKEHFAESMKPIRLHVKATLVSMGLRHTAIVNSRGEVWTTGFGKHGQLGLGNDVLSSDRFQKVDSVGKISHIACGQNHTVAWCSDEKALYVWGDNTHGQLLLSSEKYKKIFKPNKIDIGVNQEVRKILSGWKNVLLWLQDGTLLAWGSNNYGQLGVQNAVPTGIYTYVSLPGGRHVQDIALGSEHVLCLATDNSLWAWGWNEHYNTGMNTEDNRQLPTVVPLETNATITQIYAGGAFNFIVTEELDNVDLTDKNDNRML